MSKQFYTFNLSHCLNNLIYLWLTPIVTTNRTILFPAAWSSHMNMSTSITSNNLTHSPQRYTLHKGVIKITSIPTARSNNRLTKACCLATQLDGFLLLLWTSVRMNSPNNVEKMQLPSNAKVNSSPLKDDLRSAVASPTSTWSLFKKRFNALCNSQEKFNYPSRFAEAHTTSDH